MGFFMFCLAFMPCADSPGMCKKEVHLIGTDDGHAHNSNEEDNCPPFCSCNCCGVSIALYFHPFKAKDPHAVVEISQEILSIYPSYIPAFYGNIWQPPKINA